MKVSDHASTCIKSIDENTMTKADGRDISKRRQHSAFEWTQLIATICIPVIIAIYSIIDNNNKESIAVADRRKDIDIANNSRVAQLDIAQANRLNEIIIAEQSRQKDRDLALDQQRENILVEYQAFLANLIMENGMTLNKTPTAKVVAVSMILTTLTQLDTRRRGILVRSLYNSKLITIRSDSPPPSDTSILILGYADLRDITFGSSRDSPAERPLRLYIDWYHLSLPYATLTNTSFRHTSLNCATFSDANMDFVDLSFASHGSYTCFDNTREEQINFSGASLVNSSLYKVNFRFAYFGMANLSFADMREFHCMNCTFLNATLFQVDLSFSLIFKDPNFEPGGLDFRSVNLRQAVMHSAHFRTISFFQSDWSNVQASQIILWNCTFTNAKMENCSFTKSSIVRSVFQNANLFSIDLSYAKLNNVSFVNSDMRNANMSYIQCDYCDFTNVRLQSAVLKNASLRYANFLNCHVEASQLDQAIDLSGSILPNGTVVESNE